MVEAVSLARFGNYDGNLVEAIRKFKRPVEQLSGGSLNIIQFSSIIDKRNPYFLMVTHDRMDSNPNLHNTSLIISSYSERQSQEIADQFGVTQQAVAGMIETVRKVWRHLPGNPPCQPMAWNVKRFDPEEHTKVLFKV